MKIWEILSDKPLSAQDLGLDSSYNVTALEARVEVDGEVFLTYLSLNTEDEAWDMIKHFKVNLEPLEISFEEETPQ